MTECSNATPDPTTSGYTGDAYELGAYYALAAYLGREAVAEDLDEARSHLEELRHFGRTLYELTAEQALDALYAIHHATISRLSAAVDTAEHVLDPIGLERRHRPWDVPYQPP